MMNSFRKKHGEVKPILKDKEKEDKGLALQLVPEYIDKKAFKQGNHNPNYVFAGALYIPKDIIQIVNANDTGAAQIQMGPIKDGENDNSSDDQSVAIEDPDVRKYIVRILRYFKYDPEEAMATLREASFKIKNRARGIVKRTYSQNTVTKLQAWRAKVQYNEGESEDDLFNPSHSVFTPKAPSTEEGGKEGCFYGDDNEEANKQSFIQKTFTKLFPTKSSSKIDKSHLTFQEISSSDTPYSSEGERSSRKNRKSMSKSMSQLINEGNKQVTGFLSSVTTDPEEKNENFKKITIFNFNKIICNKIKKVVIMLKTIYQQKRNVHNKAAKNPTNFIYSEMYLNYQDHKRKSPRWSSKSSRKKEIKEPCPSHFSKSLTEKKSVKASHMRHYPSLPSGFLEENNVLNFDQTKYKEKIRILSRPQTSKKKSTLRPSKRGTVLTSRGSLYVRRTSAPPVNMELIPRQSSLINQRVWIQNLNVPVKYADHIVTDTKKRKFINPPETYFLHNLNESSNIYSSSESDNFILNSNLNGALSKRISNETSGKLNRNFFSIPHKSENFSSNQENDQTSIVYCSPKQNKGDKFIVAPIKQILYKPGKSSLFVDIITDPNSVHNTSSKSISDKSIKHSRNSADFTPGFISTYPNRYHISSDPPEKSSCSLLSYEESPLPIDYVQHSNSPTICNNSINKSTFNTFFERDLIISKSQPDRKSVSDLKETENVNLILPNVSGSESESKSTSSVSSNSRTTVISGPIVCDKSLGMRLQNFITKRSGALGPLKLNKIIYSSRQKGSSKECTILPERKKTYKNRFKRFNSRPTMRRIQLGQRRAKNLPVVERISPDDAELSHASVSIQDCKQTYKYTRVPSTTQKSTKRSNKHSTISAVVDAVQDTTKTKQCLTEFLEVKRHEINAQRGNNFFQPCNLNSTLCINDDSIQGKEAECYDEANCTTIGFDCSNVLLKKCNSEALKCSKSKRMDQAICSSKCLIVKSSDSDLVTSANALCTEYILKRSKHSGKNKYKSHRKEEMETKDLFQSSSELLTKEETQRSTFLPRKHPFFSNVKKVGNLSTRYHGKKEYNH